MKILIILLLTLGLLHSDELDNLLSAYANNSDLSEKTKVENGGTVTIFTRKDLDIMQARNLKDILKSNPLRRYTESRSGAADILYKGGTAAFSSSAIRVYINNQELTSATYGSSFGGAANISLDLFDHIEIYANSPSYEFTSEPTYLLIKLYTKTAERDSGGKIGLSYGSLGFNEETLSYSQELEDFSYFTSVSRTDNKRENQYSYDIPIKRDSERLFALASLYSDKHNFLFSVMKDESDMSIASSPTATYEDTEHHFNYLFLGYDTTIIDDFTFSTSVQLADIDGYRKDTLPLGDPYRSELEYKLHDHTLSTELKYNLESESNRLIAGIKFRHKSFETDYIYKNGELQLKNPYNTQNIFSAFFEERYNISDNNIINFAVHYSYVDNNAYIDDANLWQLRLAHTYLNGDFTFKSYIYHVESLVEPYIYVDTGSNVSLKPQKQTTMSEEMKYKYKSSDFRLFLAYRVHEDTIIEKLGEFSNIEYNTKNLAAYLEYTYNFNSDNKLIANISNSYSYNMPSPKRAAAAFVRSLNSVGKFDIFNEVIYNRNNTTNKNYYDYSAGVKYNHSRDLIFSVKGENIFNKGFEESYFRVDTSAPPVTLDEPLLLSPIEQRFYVTVEYLF